MAGDAGLLCVRVLPDEGGALNYYKRHIGDYAAATRHLTILEHGVYALLMDVYYGNERPLPDSIDAVARLIGARSKDEKAAVAVVLREFFVNDDGQWHQTRCDEEIAAKNEKAAFNRTVGRTGGRPRKQKTETLTVSENNPNGFQNKTDTVSENNPSHKPLAIREELRAADAASGESPSDPRKALWDLGVSVLGPNSRSVIGAACKRVGEPKVAAVLGEMAADAKAEPKAYFIAATTPKARGFVC